MSSHEIPPTVKVEDDRTIREHPAFGRIMVGYASGQYNSLFCSDLQHQHTVRLRIERACLIDSIGHQHTYQRGGIVEVILTETQWAQMVASQGRGQGTPCTLLYAPPVGTKLETMPGIVSDTVQDRHAKDFQKACKDKMDKLKAHIGNMEALLEKKTISTTLLRSKLASLRSEVERIPMDLAFMVTLFHETIEEMTSEAEANIDGYFHHLITNAGKQAYLEGKVSLNPLALEPDVE